MKINLIEFAQKETTKHGIWRLRGMSADGDPQKFNIEVNLEIEGNTPLSSALLTNKSLEVITAWLDIGARLKTTGFLNNTPLHHACEGNSHLEVIDMLVSKGQDINERNDRGATPLHKACYSNNLEIIQYLLDKGADINAVDDVGNTALSNAVHPAMTSNGIQKNEYTTYKIVQLLLDRGIKTNPIGSTQPLHILCQNMNPMMSVIRLLMDEDKNSQYINGQDTHGNTPLHYAFMRQSFNVVSLLVKAGANTEAVNDRGETPAHYAMKSSLYLATAFNLILNSKIKDDTGKLPKECVFDAGNNIVTGDTI